MMRPSALLYMYARRLRAHGAQELLAGLGIAIAVALVLSATLAERSISGSARDVVHAVAGPAQLQLRARSADGFDEALIARVRRLPGVLRAAPALEQSATLTSAGAEDTAVGGPVGRGSTGRGVRVTLAGADLRLATLDGLGETLPLGTLSGERIALSAATARALGISGRAPHAGTSGQPGAGAVLLRLRGGSARVAISAVLDRHDAGALSGALVAVLPLRRMQQLAGLPGRVSRILVQADPDRVAAVGAELRRVAGPGLEVAPADQDLGSLAQALGPSDLASGLFAAIGALLGFLLAFNAMLLTVADRRRTIADLRVEGATRATVAEMVLFEALCLGLAGSTAGVLAGWALATGAFHTSTGYLAEAFTLSPSTLLDARAVAGCSPPAWPAPCRCSTCARGGRATRCTGRAASRATRSAAPSVRGWRLLRRR
jgi:putative ABC transport system permease protein